MSDNESECSSVSSASSMDSDNGARLTGRKALMAKFSTKSADKKTRSDDKQQKPDKTKSDFKNRQRVMLISSRGITQRFRHLMSDLEKLLPHARKDHKFDNKNQISQLNELADLINCNNAIYFEVRKSQDLYMWLAKTPHGPSCKFLVQNIHTLNELNMTGNCLKGSRPFLAFDKSFESEPRFILMKELFTQIFGTPKGHRKSKPFFDHVFFFSICDDRIWFRNYQIVDRKDDSGKKDMDLVEIGPRFTLNPIKILAGGFSGSVLYENENFIHPNATRAMLKSSAAMKYAYRKHEESERKNRLAMNAVPKDDMAEVDAVFKQ